jgi:hypothetical protein
MEYIMIVNAYYVVDKESEVSKKYYEWIARKAELNKERHAFIYDEMKANGETRVYESGRIKSLSFDEGVVIPAGLRETAKGKKGDYYSDGRTKVGKAFTKKFSSFDSGKPDGALKLLKFTEFLSNMRLYNSQLWHNNHDVLIAIVPTESKFQYTPVEGLTEITSSVFNKIINNEKVELGS